MTNYDYDRRTSCAQTICFLASPWSSCKSLSLFFQFRGTITMRGSRSYCCHVGRRTTPFSAHCPPLRRQRFDKLPMRGSHNIVRNQPPLTCFCICICMQTKLHTKRIMQTKLHDTDQRATTSQTRKTKSCTRCKNDHEHAYCFSISNNLSSGKSLCL